MSRAQDRKIGRAQDRRMITHRGTGQRQYSYKDAGVDIDAAMRALSRMKEYVKSTETPAVLSGMGSFAGLFSFQKKVLVASADGVGTKLKLAFLTGKHDTVGQDLVNHCVNDIVAMGAEPLFFLDYLGTARLKPGVAVQIVRGCSIACRQNGCALIGGETAELPGMYRAGEYDLAGFIVGAADRKTLINGKRIRAGDALVGLASSGLHTNGYSLALKILKPRKTDAQLVKGLMAVHRSYLHSVRAVRRSVAVRGIAHITGGGFADNIPRVLPKGLTAVIEQGSWPVPSIFSLIEKKGNVNPIEMYRVFNMGIGMVLVVSKRDVKRTLSILAGQRLKAWEIGRVVRGNAKVMLK